MKLRYPYLSSGYLGLKTEKQTLNASFYALFENDFIQEPNKIEATITLFPQRVPRSDFFNELYQLETDEYKSAFTNRLSSIKDSFKIIAKTANLTRSENSIRHYLNWANLCLRHGCLEQFTFQHLQNIEDLPFTLEIELLHEAINIEQKLSADILLTADNYLSLAENYLNKEFVSDREKIMLLNNLIVTYYRHQHSRGNSKAITAYAKHLASLTEKFDNDSLPNQLYCSVAYRGLAMVSTFNPHQQSEFLAKAEWTAMKMYSDNPSDKIVTHENLYTCFQSIAKWHEMNGEFDLAEEYLLRMIKIDPFDSTGFSALGFLYLNNHNYSMAADNFKKALDLGPPGAGMNAYFYAKCLENCGKKNEAVNYLLESANLDTQALSPRLDLIEHYKKNNNARMMNTIANQILNNQILRDQLENAELEYIKNLPY